MEAASTGSFDESFTKIEKGEKEDLFDSSLDVPAKLPDYDETELIHAEQGLRITSPDHIPMAEVWGFIDEFRAYGMVVCKNRIIADLFRK